MPCHYFYHAATLFFGFLINNNIMDRYFVHTGTCIGMIVRTDRPGSSCGIVYTGKILITLNIRKSNVAHTTSQFALFEYIILYFYVNVC